MYKAEFSNPPTEGTIGATPLARAEQLLRSVMPENIANALLKDGYAEVQGTFYNYQLYLTMKTRIPKVRVLCIEFVDIPITSSSDAANLDRLVMEYLLIKGDEERYLRTCR